MAKIDLIKTFVDLTSPDLNKYLISRAPQPGDVIVVKRYLKKKLGFMHYGIYVGNDRAVHFRGKKAEIDPENALIIETSLAEFAKGSKVYVEELEKLCALSSEDVKKHALEMVDMEKGKYNLATYNCEHFANWCKYGKKFSRQVENCCLAAIDTSVNIVVEKTFDKLLKLLDKKNNC